jgi:hypothetical protein
MVIQMAKRINVILPEQTIRTIDRMAPRGERSRFIDKAVRHYVAQRSAEALHEQLKQAAIRDRDLDLEITDEWSAVDLETWRDIDRNEGRKAPGRSAEKSTSRRSTRQ